MDTAQAHTEGEETMKKCPMQLTVYNGGSGYIECIGKKCAAYVEEAKIVVSATAVTQNDTKSKLMWRCSALPLELWHDVEMENKNG